VCSFTEKRNFAPLYDRLLPLIESANVRNWNWKVPFDVNSPGVELAQFSVYNSSDAGFYEWHVDVGLRGATGRRKLSVTLQLTDPSTYEGGDLEIVTGNPSNPLKLPRNLGGAVIFPSYTLHRVSPVTKGVRYSVVLWLEELY